MLFRSEQRAEGDTRLAATRLKGELAKKLTPSDMTEAGEKVAEWRARQPRFASRYRAFKARP